MKMTDRPYHIPEYTRKALMAFEPDIVTDEDVQYIIDHTYGVTTLFIDDEPAILACIFEMDSRLFFTGGATWRGPKYYSFALNCARRLLHGARNRDIFSFTTPNNYPVLLTLGMLGFKIYQASGEKISLVKLSEEHLQEDY